MMINQLISEINNIKSKIPFDIQPNDKLMSIIIITYDYKIHTSIICKNSENFERIEKELYERYPDYRDSENYFIYNANIIDKSKTLDENKIKNNSILILAHS